MTALVTVKLCLGGQEAGVPGGLSRFLDVVEPAAVVAATAVSSTAAPVSDMPAGDTEAMNIINGLGGKANILSLENCITRLRVTMADPSLLDESLINRTVNSGIVKKGSDVQIVYGLRVADVKRDVEEQLEKL